MKAGGYLSTSEAAQTLGISLPTLYSYVSRGLLRTELANSGKRTRRYHAGEEYQADRIIRPRAHYIGTLPNTEKGP